jgi:hypothetical protein
MIAKIEFTVDAPICRCANSQKNATILVDLQRVQIACAECGSLVQTPFVQVAVLITTLKPSAGGPPPDSESSPSKLVN